MVLACPKCQVSLKQVEVSGLSVYLEQCPKCGGFWFDEGQIYHFAENAAEPEARMTQPLTNARAASWNCPRCATATMQTGELARNVSVTRCETCKGIWFDKEDLNQFFSVLFDGMQISATMEAAPPPEKVWPGIAGGLFLSGTQFSENSLVARATAILGVLYGILFLFFVLMADVWNLGKNVALIVTVAIILIQFIVGPFLMDYSLQWFYSLHWATSEELPERLATFIRNACKDEDITLKKIGIIEDGAPNAFSYGHYPGDGRLVLTRGLMSMLNPEELEAVVGHEMGHIKHWDMLVMTVASLAPIFLYMIYRFCISVARTKGGGKNNPAAYFFLVAVGAYLSFVLAQYIVLLLSRVREYWADQFGGELTHNPNALATALVKIAYGLAAEGAKAETHKEHQGSKAAPFQVLGLFDHNAAKGFVSLLAGRTSGPGMPVADPETVKDAMSWDLWNPWAAWYEMQSTHPLPAKRIGALGAQATSYGQKPYIVFDRKNPGSFWEEFLVDFLFLSLPWLGLFAGLALVLLGPISYHTLASFFRTLPSNFWGMPLACFSVGYLLKTIFSYPLGPFPKYSIAGLIKNLKVSQVRSIPCRIRGKVVGRGIPGLIWSSDFTLQDPTGFLFLDYHQPLSILNFLFGLLRARDYSGREVEVVGWYRRSPIPYLELLSISTGEETAKSYTFPAKIILSIFGVALGAAVLIWL